MVGVFLPKPTFPPLPRSACGCGVQLRIPSASPAWELRLLFDLVCFGLLIKHVLCCVGGASRSGAERFTHPLYSFLSHRCAAAPRRAEAPRGAGGGGGRLGPATPEEGAPPTPPSSSHASSRHCQPFHRFCTSVAVLSPCTLPVPVSSLRLQADVSDVSRGGRSWSDWSRKSCDSAPG